MKVALVCPGIGQCQRGFERYFSDLFRVLHDRVEVTLFKGAGPEGPREKVPAFVPRNGRLSHALPIHRLVGKTPYHTESLTYGLSVLPHLRRGDFDVVHTIDPPLQKVLYWLRSKTGGRFRLLHTIACFMPHEFYPGADLIHHVGKAAYDDALAYGFSPEYLSLLPIGYPAERFRPGGDRQALRRKHGVPEDAFVILSVAAVNRKQKRIDHLIEEVARLEGNFFLLIDGSTEIGGDVDLSLIDLARERLGARVRFCHVPSEEVIELYRLADLKVLTSLHEAFSIALVEAVSTHLPVLAHDNSHFRWLLGNEASLVDMSRPGALTGRLEKLMKDRDTLPELAAPENVRRFDWATLVDDYVELYRHVASIPR